MQRLCPQLIYDDCIPVLGEYLPGVVGYDFTTIIPKGTDIQCLVFSMRSKNITAKAITSGRYTQKKNYTRLRMACIARLFLIRSLFPDETIVHFF